MNNQRLIHDATHSSQGTIYQFYVAVQKCFKMRSGHRVFIEKYGDVTISNDEQAEIKYRKDVLTDNHICFWKTFKNWMQDEFDDTFYTSLILYTKQQFSEYSKLSNWNEMSTDHRLETLSDIHSNFRKTAKINNEQRSNTILYMQEYILDQNRSQKLKRIIKKFYIVTNTPDMSNLYQQLCDEYCKGILKSKQKDFLDALVGFILRPALDSKSSWEISFEDFTNQVKELTGLFSSGKKIFPTKYRISTLTRAEKKKCKKRIFVKKIRDIEYHQVIREAIRSYLFALWTVQKDISSFEISKSHFEEYVDEVIEQTFIPKFRRAQRKAYQNEPLNIINDSQTFYDEITSDDSPILSGFESTPKSFRNGVIHMYIDDSEKDLKWRLEKY